MAKNRQITVVFISGFLTPRDWQSYPSDAIPSNINLIPVYPSPAGSLHDRACQIFYELLGGVVDYGSEHSSFHKHERFGRNFKKGKFAVWNKDNPIIIIGHSLGGCTAWVLQNYLDQKRFPGKDTSADWISGIICVNSPLNGALQVHGKGMDLCHPPVVRWGSTGCIIGWVAQWSEYIDCSIVNDHMDFQQEHWKLTRNDPGSFKKLLYSLLGYCLHSGTDNVAYDVTIQSQLEWAKVLKSFPNSHYISVVGKLEDVQVKTWGLYELVSLGYSAVTKLLRGEAPPLISDVDTSRWMRTGSDGLLTVFTQEYPRLFTTTAATVPVCSGECCQRPNSCKMCLPNRTRANKSAILWPEHTGRQFQSDVLYSQQVQLERGVWHYTHRNISHLNAGLACKETWAFLAQAVQVLADQHRHDQPSVRVVYSATKKDKPRASRGMRNGSRNKAEYPAQSSSPDMQSAAHLHLPCRHTSTAMAFRWSNLSFAAILASTIAMSSVVSSAELAVAIDMSNIDAANMLYILLCAGLAGMSLYCLLVLRPSAESGAPYYYFPNDAYMVSEAAEIAYSAYRVVSACNSLSVGLTSLPSSSLLCEMLLLSLLPRPLFDYKNQPATVLLGIILAFYPALWSAAVLRANVLYLALTMECLAKLPWLVLYCTRREDNKLIGAELRRCCALGAMLLYLTCWGLFLAELWTVYTNFEVSTAATTSATVNRVIMVLWALYPLSKFQDLSECVQYVMIERYY